MTLSGEALIARLPKAELHLHIEGSIEPEMVLEFAERNGIDFPHKSIEALRATYEFDNLAGFGAVYRSNSQVLRTGRDFHDMTYAYMRRVRQDEVMHAEVAFAPQGASKRGVDPIEALEAVLDAMELAKADFGMTGGVIIGCQRNWGSDEGLAMLQTVKPYRDRIMALGLASMEVGFPPRLFERMFDEARDMGWKTTAHAGEEGPPEYIWEALDILKVDRIDHGVRCEEDPNLMARLAEEQIPLTVCPLSNICLKVFSTLAQHNVARLLRSGLLVTVNSDDPPYFGGYVNAEYAECRKALALTDDEIVQLARNSFIGSFLPKSETSRYLSAIDLVLAGQFDTHPTECLRP
ncbi:adenosine deaminase [Microvirga sp. BT688]|uniref:adenosine deaminase n=1 Tax=Microvirga sp. TaxID=1873136 RepID=UPI00168A3050|nr:adenosine deaminase [Microvirga sp.]MBD2750515.1 adenosine deaminase [Microvirga sp.]